MKKLVMIAVTFQRGRAPAHAINAKSKRASAVPLCTKTDGSVLAISTKASDGKCRNTTCAKPFTIPCVKPHSHRTVNATISNGFFSATVNGKKATVKRLNANFYEIHGKDLLYPLALMRTVLRMLPGINKGRARTFCR
jgi:hypothetical protein